MAGTSSEEEDTEDPWRHLGARDVSSHSTPQLTMRATATGLVVGTLLCFTNMYFGLQTGWVTMGSIQVRRRS
jgi:uncharacterized oligopeptide transporter (OPT) family protein